MPAWQRLFTALREHGIPVSDSDLPRPVGGGDISSAWRVRTDDANVFLKTGPASAYEMFGAEADGLKELEKAGAVRVPKVLGCIVSGTEAVLALEWLQLEPADSQADAELGSALAIQHRYLADSFGWHRDNTIGATPQKNGWHDDWVEFLATRRLGFQLELAAQNGYRGELESRGKALLDTVGHFFSDYWPEPSLLHGDLWSGNRASVGGVPVVYDPAVYYGDREADIAMAMLFGGFAPSFFAAYLEAWPLAPGHERRLALYKLYHVLNHLNLFGRSYLARARAIMDDLLS